MESLIKNTKRLSVYIRQLFSSWAVIKDASLKKEFFTEVSLLNFNRQKYFGYFLLLMGSIQLYADFFWGDSWDTHQLSSFMILDITVLVFAIAIVLISHIRPPKNPQDIKPWHKVYFYIYLIYHLAWSLGISIIEAKSANGVPTFLVGVFAAATIYLPRSLPFLILLLASAIGLIAGLKLTGMETELIVNQYSPTIILVLIAWLVSKVLMHTRMKSFIARKEIESVRDNLDITVKERTEELQKSNEQLLGEIKERQRYERGLEREKKKAEEADQLKSAFLANMSHEIRTPLNGIIGFGDLLKNPDLSIEKKERYTEIMNTNGQQLLKIIDDLMDISMIESNQLKLNHIEFRIAHILPDAEIFFKNYLRIHNKEHIKIINDGFYGTGDDIILSDPARVQQILYNLISNAAKFTHNGHIRFGAKIEDGIILVYVEDTGIGISHEKCDAIFQRFRQGEESTSRAYGGTGLGLSISKGIIELLGGMIWVDLSYSKGARFCFTLPTKEVQVKATGSKLLQSLKLIQKKGVLISHTDTEELGFLDYFLTCQNLQMRKVHWNDLATLDEENSGEIFLLDLQYSELLNYAKVVQQILDINNSYLIVAIKPNPELKQSLNDLGCHQVVEAPVNINILLSKIKSEIMDKVLA